MKADEDKMKEHGKKLASKIISNWRKSVRERGASVRERAEPSAHPSDGTPKDAKDSEPEYIGFDEALTQTVGEGDIVPAHDSGVNVQLHLLRMTHDLQRRRSIISARNQLWTMRFIWMLPYKELRRCFRVLSSKLPIKGKEECTNPQNNASRDIIAFLGGHRP